MNTMKNILLLASKSVSRQQLLRQAHIPFTIVNQDANEHDVNWNMPLSQLVTILAIYKMANVQLPPGKHDGDTCFVLTADTLSQDLDGTIQGKPTDRADAIAKIKSARAGSKLSTAFCLDRKVWTDRKWHNDERITQAVGSEYIFDVPDALIESYLDSSIALQTAGAITIEDIGMQFLKTVNGSYSTIIGLPMFELRQALHKIGFNS